MGELIIALKVEHELGQKCLDVINNYPVELLNDHRNNGAHLFGETINKYKDDLNNKDLSDNFDAMVAQEFEYLFDLHHEQNIKNIREFITEKYKDMNDRFLLNVVTDYTKGLVNITMFISAYIVCESGKEHFKENPFKEIFERLNSEIEG